MANPTIITQIGHADPEAAPLKINELIDLLNTLIASEMTGSYIPYVISVAEPSVDNRDKAWIQLDSQGRPIATKIWFVGAAGGAWRRIYNGMPGEIRGYRGNPTVDFDVNGRGKIGLTYDGWQICNGKNGSPNMTDKFLVGAHMDNSGGHVGYGPSGWQTFVDGTGVHAIGGAAKVTLNQNNTYRPERPIITVDRWEADGNTNNVGGVLWGKGGDPHAKTGDFTLLKEDPGNTTPDPITVLPPYLALAWIIFLGYDA